MKPGCISLLLALLLLLPGGALRADVPQVMNYQGVLTNPQGEPYHGAVNVLFEIFNVQNGGSPLWAEDHPLLDVENGFFRTLLGTIEPLPDSIWESESLWLAITVGDADEMAPRMDIAAVPFSFRARIAEQVVGGSGTGDGHSLDAADGSPTDALFVDEAGEVGIGTTEPATSLHVMGPPVSARGQLSLGAPTSQDVFMSYYCGDLFATYLWYDVSDLDLRLQNVNDFYGGDLSLNPYGGNVGVGTSDPTEALEVVGTISSTTGGFKLPDGTLLATAADIGSGDSHWVRADDNLWADVPGNVGIGTTNPQEKLHVEGRVQVKGPGTIYPAYLGHLDGSVYAQAFNENNLAANIYGALGHDPYGIYAYNSSGGVAINIDGLSRFNGGAIVLGNTWSSRALYVDGSNNTYAAEIKGNVLIRSADTNEPVIELGEGLDYAEGFDVAGDLKPEPGSVLSIDPENPGRLTPSCCAYDSKVAGIVAGAESLGSGVRLGVGQFDCDVALAGRVYCNVDATDEEVKPGDLLTTSQRTGFAMKATDVSRTGGAILGKAMEPMARGQSGRILVLVTLQ